ncbi:Glyoxylase, beta-lactamase superfamily II [Paenibacillus sp. UNC496MF]|uniref:MBL fold metallo-hydrolase n=1 Tax=Paenibacillus sp. UNC496MF TaxID=1502753 RepID=UPI0008ECC1D4|nr:MBL fold metallo-hydrolase [Paenibacillus sp. UNC496MF]SFJ00041.1 Glyoxylase, beta-lactamase superfamily II [Paenibacillus sp. UNC496MF]
MKIERISEHVWSLSTWVIIPIHVWAVVEKDGITLVDAGISMMTKGIAEFAEKRLGLPLRRIVLTHGHGDHTGAVKKLAERYPDVTVYAHEIEIPYMEGKLAYPGRKKPQQSVAPGLANPLPAVADGTLARVGGLSAHLTPGHSPGHVVYFHEADGVMLAGDLFTSKGGRLRKPMPMFTADMAEAVRSSEIVRKLRPSRLEVCHGGAVLNPADQLDAYQRSQGFAGGGGGVSLQR